MDPVSLASIGDHFSETPVVHSAMQTKMEYTENWKGQFLSLTKNKGNAVWQNGTDFHY